MSFRSLSLVGCWWTVETEALARAPLRWMSGWWRVIERPVLLVYPIVTCQSPAGHSTTGAERLPTAGAWTCLRLKVGTLGNGQRQLTSPQGAEAEEMMGLQCLQGHLAPFCKQSEDGRQVAGGQKHPEGRERSSAGRSCGAPGLGLAITFHQHRDGRVQGNNIVRTGQQNIVR